MKQKRRNFTNSFKTKVVLEALKERDTIQQLAVKYEIHPNQITTWKKQFLENADAAFGQQGQDDQLQQARQQLDELYKQIGQMKVETDWLKKKLL
jgi:transposase-like protein